MGFPVGCSYRGCIPEHECKYVFHNDCPNYRRHRRNYLLSEIKPVVLTKEVFESTQVVPLGTAIFSRNEAALKAIVAVNSIKLNMRVKKLTLSQAITATMESFEVEDDIIYVECASTGVDIVKAKQVLVSFVDKALLSNKRVFIFSKIVNIIAEDNWQKV